MKKIIYLMLVLLLLCGCFNKLEDKDNKINIMGVDYLMNKDDSSYSLTYKVAPNFERKNLVNTVSYFSEKKDDSYSFIIRIFEYDIKKYDIDKCIKDLTDLNNLSKEEIKINNLDYAYVFYGNGENQIDIYLHQTDKHIYAITFLSKEKREELSKTFLKEVKYND